MKPTRGLPHSWLGSMPRERRTALVSVAVLLMLLGAIVVYQQFQVPTEQSPQVPPPTEAPPVRAGGSPLAGAPNTAAMPAADAEPGAAVAEGQPGAPEGSPRQSAPPDRLSAPLAGQPAIIKAYNSLDEAYGDFRLYTAIAYAAEPGQSVLAPASGKVAAIEEDPAEGLTLVLDLGGGLTTYFSGLGKVLVARGDQVDGGAVIAQTGQPGLARTKLGPHLAFQVRLDNAPVDPTTYLRDQPPRQTP